MRFLAISPRRNLRFEEQTNLAWRNLPGTRAQSLRSFRRVSLDNVNAVCFEKRPDIHTCTEEEEEASCLSTAADLCIKGSFAYSTPFASNYTHTYTRRECQAREFTDPPMSPARSVSGMLNEQSRANVTYQGESP